MKTYFQKITLLACAALLTFSACKKDDDGDGNKACGSADEFPFMATGHQLTYAYNEFLGNDGDYTHTYGEQDANGNFKIALTGNPNCGKTTLFNALTGLRAKVGNYAGVTVERKEGRLLAAPPGMDLRVVDLPGTYSLAPNSVDEHG